MKSCKALLFSLTLLLALPAAPQQASSNVAASASTAVPPLIPYSGVVSTVPGAQPAASASIAFLIYKDEQSGEPLFAETQTVALDVTGHYKAQLGATLANGIPMDLFATGEARWLEVQVAGEAPQPRVLLVSVPYALKAADAATLGGLPPSAFALARPTSEAASALSPAITPDTASNVTTTGGLAGYVPEFSGASSIVDSPLFVSGAKIGIGTAAPLETLDVRGTAIASGLIVNGVTTIGGSLGLAPLSFNATPATGYNSQLLKLVGSAYDSASKTIVNPRFVWQATVTGNNTAAPSATLNLLSATTAAVAAPTGFYFNPNGTINFAPGQTFPGAGITGTVNATSYNLGGSSFATGSTSARTAYLGFAGNPGSSGANDTGVGYGALSSNTTGLGNTAIGVSALFKNTTGGDNTAIGLDTLSNNTTGNTNTASGAYALASTTNGLSNTAIGYSAMYNNTIGSSNTAVGDTALQTNLTGSSLTAIGIGADVSSPTAISNATALGANAVVSQSNSLVLGETTAGSPGATYVNVGIGTATPRSILEASVSASSALGPALTLTNTAGGLSAAASIDFNTYYHPAVPYHNPTSRIEAVDDNNYGNALYFQSKTPGSDTNGLQTNMVIFSNGKISIGATIPLAQLGVAGPSGSGTAAISGIGGSFDMSPDSGTPGSGGNFIGGEGDYVGSGGGDGAGGEGITAVGGSGNYVGGDGGDFTGGIGGIAGGTGIYATAGTGSPGDEEAAGQFNGDVYVTGGLSAATKNFKIDHPLDPANKYLVHASVESSEMMNIYSGNVVTDELGLATIKLPDWFEAENTDFRYQLTVIGQFAQAIVKDKIANGQFRIMTNASRVEVSWQITAVRQDAYAKAHPLIVEQEKPERERGFYQNPELYGQPAEKQTEWGRRPQQMQRMKQMQEQQRLRAQQHQAPILTHDQPASAVNQHFATSERPLPSKSELGPATPPARN